jgi:hypothetical protein
MRVYGHDLISKKRDEDTPIVEEELPVEVS